MRQRRKWHSFWALLMVLVMCLPGTSLSFADRASTGYVEPAPGEVRVTKTAEAVPGTVNLWQVTLKIEGKKDQSTSDVVLVIDESGSMGYSGSGGGGTKLDATKAGAKQFVNQLLSGSGSETTRIGIVTFSGDINTVIGLTNDKASLLSTIRNLTADGATYTQGAIHKAQEMLAGSTADHKHIVLLSDGIPTKSVTLIDNLKAKDLLPSTNYYYYYYFTKTGYPQSYYQYNMGPAGSGVRPDVDKDMTDQNSGGEYGSVTVNGWEYDVYYNHINSTLNEAGYIKATSTNLWAIALELNASDAVDRAGIATLQGIASPGKFRETNVAGLSSIFADIAGEIGLAARDMTVNDPMGTGFEPFTADPSLPVTTFPESSAYEWLADGTLRWNPGNLDTDDPEHPGVQMASITYYVGINDAIINAPHDAENSYPTNGDAVLTYTDQGNNVLEKHFVSPRVKPRIYYVTKELLDEKGNKLENADLDFTVTVDGPTLSDPEGYHQDFVVNPSVNGGSKLMTDLIKASRYRFKETAVSSGSLDDYDVKYGVTGVDGITNGNGGLIDIAPGSDGRFQLKVINQLRKKIDINVEKVWKNVPSGTTPAPITVELYRDGAYTGKSLTLNAENGWKGTFASLNEAAYGVPYVYTVRENPAPTDYTVWIEKTADAEGNISFTLTNTGKLDIPVTKVWQDDDDRDGFRPEAITVTLYENGAPTDKTLSLSASNNWSGAFEGLPREKNGVPVKYAVRETLPAAADEHYEQSVAGSAEAGFTLTNKHTPETVTISGEKTWNDNNDAAKMRPSSITVRLFKGDTELGHKTVTAANGWKWAFPGLPKYENGELIRYRIQEDSIEHYTTSVNGYDVANTYNPKKISFRVTKVWDDADNQDGKRPNSITVKLIANGKDTGKTVVLDPSNQWTAYFENLDKYYDNKEIVYEVRESEIPDGYTSGDPAGDVSTGFTITNIHTPETIDIAGAKTWDDNNDQDGKRPDKITVTLLKDGKPFRTAAVSAADGWKWSFKGLPKYAAGEECAYTVKETIENNPGYVSEVNGYDITNRYKPQTFELPVSKVWHDAEDQDGVRPDSITVKLFANGKDTGKSLILDALTGWKGVFKDLPVYENGVPIKYSIREVLPKEAAEKYTTSISGTEITNTHDPETIALSGQKTWDDNNDQDGKRPDEITVTLLKDGKPFRTATVSAADGWKWSFKGLPKYKNHGETVIYTILESGVDEYAAEYDGMNITNSYSPEKISIPVRKLWNDAENQDGKRPESVTVKLYAFDKDTGKTLVLNEANKWAGSFADLDKYRGGEKIEYSVKEVPVGNGYTAAITGTMADGFTVSNSRTPEVMTIKGMKHWEDNGDQDGKRPDSITILLYADDELKVERVVAAKDNWVWSFDNLPVYKNGQKIVYRIAEKPVEDYVLSPINAGYDLTNIHKPEKTSVPVEKKWDDNNDQDGIRPEAVKIRLLANGAATEKVLILDEDNGWKGAFAELDVYKNGQPIVYTVREEETPAGYTASAPAGTAEKGFEITNYHKPAVTSISGAKTWDDKDNQDNKRPSQITVRLLKNGKETAHKVVTADDGWAWTFGGLPVNENGAKIVYTISEDRVEDYATEINGYNITNSYTPEKTGVSVAKAWDDKENQDGIRPLSVTVRLYADGKDTGKTAELNAANHWAASFEGLDVYHQGKKIEYTVGESPVPAGYVVSGTTGDASKGYRITNTHVPETIELSGSKTWKDNHDQDGARPDAIEITLMKNGTAFKTVTVTEKDGWAWSFAGLDKYAKSKPITYSVTEKAIDGYSATYDGMNVTNSHTPDKTSVSVSKAWNDKNDQDGIRPVSVTVKLYANGIDTGKSVVLNKANKWTASFEDLDENMNGSEILYTVKEDPVPAGYLASPPAGDARSGFTITNTHIPETVNLAGAKTWNDNDDQDGMRPDEITVNLYKDGKPFKSMTVSKDDNWTWSFNGLDKYRDNGTPITYTLVESAVEGYVPVVDGFDITNTHAPGKTSVAVSKAWDDANDQDGIRPKDITIALYADGKDTGKTLILNEGNGWTGIFADLDVNKGGMPIAYTVAEKNVPEGYTVSKPAGDAASGFTITNTHNPETVSLFGEKNWNDNENQDNKRPEAITVKLMKDGSVFKTLQVTEKDGWKWSFSELPKFRDHGVEILYAIAEEAVPEYTAKYDGMNIENTHAPDKTSITVSKSWEDHDDQDGLRPEDVVIRLLANGKDTGKTVVLNEGNGWTGIFENLDVNKNGMPIDYTVEEQDVPEGYAATIAGNAKDGFEIANVHEPETIALSGEKTWDDNDNQDGMRPDEITIRLFADGKPVLEKTVTEKDGWKWTFDDLPKFRDRGTEIVYTLTEDAIEGYVASYDGLNVKNAHAPGKTSVSVSKVWEDENNVDGIRPSEITVSLLADGKPCGMTLVLNEKNGWTGSFTDLDVYKAGKKIDYSVQEAELDGYQSVVTGNPVKGFTLTNSHTPAAITVSGAKTWDDDNDRQGLRPESVTINLLRDGKLFRSMTVSEKDGWKWSFDNLPKFRDQGTEIVYSISENSIEHYTAAYKDYDVTNTVSPEKTSVTVSKRWNDRNDRDGIRPDQVRVTLLANGEPTKQTLVLSDANQWTDSFRDLDIYKDGKKIVYEVQEDAVNGYRTTYSGNQTAGFLITNSHTTAPKTGISVLPLAGYGLVMAGASAALALLRKRKDEDER